GFERLYGGAKPSPQGGRLLLTELGCVSCHKAGDDFPPSRRGPILDHVGGRVRVSHLRKFLRDPHAVKPGTTMPDLLAGEADREGKVEALVPFLASTGALKQGRPDRRTIASGRDLYHKVGCVACHGTRAPDGSQDRVLPTSVPLGDLKAKYTLASLGAFL